MPVSNKVGRCAHFPGVLQAEAGCARLGGNVPVSFSRLELVAYHLSPAKRELRGASDTLPQLTKWQTQYFALMLGACVPLPAPGGPPDCQHVRSTTLRSSNRSISFSCHLSAPLSFRQRFSTRGHVLLLPELERAPLGRPLSCRWVLLDFSCARAHRDAATYPYWNWTRQEKAGPRLSRD